MLDDDVLSWLARVIGHDLHLYRDDKLIASSRRDLFAARVESQRLPGDVYANIVVGGKQLAIRNSGPAQFIEIYSPINLVRGQNYTMALPLIVQGRQIEAQVNDLATTIYMLLIFIILAAIFVAYVAARSVTQPVQALVAGSRAVARGDFDMDLRVPSDPDLGLLVTTFRDMARSIRRQQNDLRHERDRLQTLLENINAAVVVLDGTMQVSGTNAGARRLFGESIEFHDEVRDFLATHQRGRAEAKEIELNVDGNARTFRVSIVPLPGSDEEMLIAEDVTEILRSNRLEAWGEMARQVAHEIKNPLTPIQLTAEHLRAVASNNDPNLSKVVMAAVDNILRQVVTLRETSKEFSDYASLRTVQRKPVELRHLLEEIAVELRRKRRARHRLPRRHRAVDAGDVLRRRAPAPRRDRQPDRERVPGRARRRGAAGQLRRRFESRRLRRRQRPRRRARSAAENLRPLLLHEILRHRPRTGHHAQSRRRARRLGARRESQSRLPHIIGAPGSLK